MLQTEGQIPQWSTAAELEGQLAAANLLAANCIYAGIHEQQNLHFVIYFVIWQNLEYTNIMHLIHLFVFKPLMFFFFSFQIVLKLVTNPQISSLLCFI